MLQQRSSTLSLRLDHQNRLEADRKSRPHRTRQLQLQRDAEYLASRPRLFLAWDNDALRKLDASKRFPWNAGADLDPVADTLDAAGRHQMWSFYLQQAKLNGVDTTEFLVRLANTLFELKAPVEAFQVASQISDSALAADPRLAASLETMRSEFQKYQQQQHTEHARLSDLYHTPRRVETFGAYKGSASDELSRARLETVVSENRLLAERFGVGVIMRAVAGKHGFKKNDIKHFFVGKTGAEAVKIAAAFDILNDEGRSSRVTSSNAARLKKIAASVEAIRVMDDLAARVRTAPQSITPEDIVSTVRSVHEILASAEPYRLSAVTNLPFFVNPGKWRSRIAHSSNILFPKPQVIPTLMLDFGERATALLRSDQLHPLEFASWAHTNITMIRPFAKYNGTVARLFASLSTLATCDTLLQVDNAGRRDQYLAAGDHAAGVNTLDPRQPGKMSLAPMSAVLAKHSLEHCKTRYSDCFRIFQDDVDISTLALPLGWKPSEIDEDRLKLGMKPQREVIEAKPMRRQSTATLLPAQPPQRSESPLTGDNWEIPNGGVFAIDNFEQQSSFGANELPTALEQLSLSFARQRNSKAMRSAAVRISKTDDLYVTPPLEGDGGSLKQKQSKLQQKAALSV